MKILFRLLGKSDWMTNFFNRRGIDIRPLPSMDWGNQKELHVLNDTEWRGIQRREAKEKKEREDFINASLYGGS